MPAQISTKPGRRDGAFTGETPREGAVRRVRLRFWVSHVIHDQNSGERGSSDRARR
jgi:hypothetical protein